MYDCTLCKVCGLLFYSVSNTQPNKYLGSREILKESNTEISREGLEKEYSAGANNMALGGNICQKDVKRNAARVCSVVSLDTREPRAPLKRQVSVDEERGCGGHWAGRGAAPEGARGLRLYRAHLIKSLRIAGFKVPQCALLQVKADDSWWEWFWDARALNKASKRFANSPQRAALRVRAASVQLAALDFPTFQHILQTLFQEGGASIERVLALFFFLSDLSCQALRSGFRAHFCRVTGWASRHIYEGATPWVQRHGGWGRVIRGQSARDADYLEAATLAAVTAACAFAAICFYRLVIREPRAISNNC